MSVHRESALLMGLVSAVTSVAWLVLAGLSYNVVVLSWLGLTGVVFGVSVWKFSGEVIRLPAWWVWLVLSVVGVVLNWFGSSVYLVGYYPWYVLLGVGYLFSGLYNWSDDRLDRLDRVVLVVFGLLSLLVALLSVTVFSIPTVFFESMFVSPVILFCLSVVPTTVLSIRFGMRAEEKDD